MNLILDACSVINLSNGRCFFGVLGLYGFTWHVGPLVVGECGGTPRVELETAIARTQVSLLDDSTIPSSRFGALLAKYQLGAGETECIMFATSLGLSVCTDDGRARTAVTNEIGSARLTGSIGLLKSAVHQGLLSAPDAYVAYQLMIASGGFLPRLPPNYF